MGQRTGFSKSVSNFFSFGGNKSPVPEENSSQESNMLITTEVNIENASNSTKSSSLAPLATPDKSSSVTPEIKRTKNEEIEMKAKRMPMLDQMDKKVEAYLMKSISCS